MVAHNAVNCLWEGFIMTFIASPYQKAIFRFVKDSKNGSAIINACAGSGKSTTAVKAAKRVPFEKDSLFLAFNKAIANELRERLPEHVPAMTLNGLGHRAWMKFRDGNIKLNSSKTFDVIKAMTDNNSKHRNEDINPWEMRRLGSQIRQLVRVAKAFGIVPNGVDGAEGLLEDSYQTWEQMIEHFDISFGGGERTLNPPNPEKDKYTAIDYAREVLKVSLGLWDEIDFDDQLYLPVVFNAPTSKYHVIFVDEAQDLSAIQRRLVRKALRNKGGRLFAIGDARQAIYGWRGADVNSMAMIAEEFGCASLPLTISYRCPKAVVREAQKYCPEIEASETAEEGIVEDRGLYDPKIFQPGDMVLCRFNAPLVRVAYRLIGGGVPAAIVGRDISGNLAALVKKLGSTTIPGLCNDLREWRTKEIERLKSKDENADTTKVEDKFEMLHSFIQCAVPKTVQELLGMIERLFGDGSPETVNLSTVHKAKGLEADRVFLLNFHVTNNYARQPWQIEQEKCIRYVAVTRARKALYFISSGRETADLWT